MEFPIPGEGVLIKNWWRRCVAKQNNWPNLSARSHPLTPFCFALNQWPLIWIIHNKLSTFFSSNHPIYGTIFNFLGTFCQKWAENVFCFESWPKSYCHRLTPFFVVSLNDPLLEKKKISRKDPSFELLSKHPVTSKVEYPPPPVNNLHSYSNFHHHKHLNCTSCGIPISNNPAKYLKLHPVTTQICL